MREFTPLPTATRRTGNLTDDVVRNAREAPDSLLFSRRLPTGWQDVTAAQFQAEVQAAAKGLLASGVEPGDRVAIISKTRYEWTLLDYATWWVGGVIVPIYASSSAEQISWILSDSGAVACLVETAHHRGRVEEVRAKLPALRNLWTIEDYALSDLGSAGARVPDTELEERRAAVLPDHLATLIYTSGTTGSPKGCMLTHANFIFEIEGAIPDLEDLFDVEGASTLLFMPLPHVFARVIQVGCVRMRVRLGHAADARSLVEDLGDFQPTFFLAVPRVFEKVFNTASQKAHSEGRGRRFDAAATVAIARSQALDRRRHVPASWLRHRAYDRLVYADLRAALGGRVQHAVSGGAPLGDRLAHFFRGIGITVLEGYGLTETTGAVTVNTPTSLRIGTVGRPLRGTEVRVADSGELLFRGGQVFRGYWRDEKATREALDRDGWLHTGDLGEVDGEGYVSVFGRLKETLVTAGGKQVVPAVLEDAVRSHPLVSQCLVVGEARPYVGALVTLDSEAFHAWRHRHGKRGKLTDLVEDGDLLAEVANAVDAANARVSRAEAIRRFRILSTDWTEESGHLTPTQKLKRRVVLADARDEVERLYR